MNSKRVRTIIESDFVLGITIAFELGDDWIKENISSIASVEKGKVSRSVIPGHFRGKRIITFSSNLQIITGATIILWVPGRDIHFANYEVINLDSYGKNS